MLSIVTGDGWNEIFGQLGCDIVSGGQTMNPSVQELMNGVKNGEYEKYLILPNNKNIILAAKQLRKMLGDTVTTIPSVNVMEGLVAAMAFNPKASVEENEKAMNEAMTEVKTGMITTAVRDSVIGDTKIHKDDFLGMSKGMKVIAEKSLEKCFSVLLKNLVNEDSEIVTVYYGNDITENECLKLIENVEFEHKDLTFEMQYGVQPLYPLMVSVE